MLKNKKNKLFLFFLLIFFLLIGTDFVLGTETLPGAPETLHGYIKHLYNLSLTIGTLLVFGILIYEGFRYLASAGNPAIIADAKDQILAATLGLIILLSSYLILYTIDPQLVILKLPGIEKPPAVTPAPVAPEEKIYSYQEIPIGILITRALEKEKLDEIKEVSEKIKTVSRELKELTEELRVLTNRCICGNTTPNATACTYGQPCPATECLGDPCSNREEINTKIIEINLKIKELEGYIDNQGNDKPGLLDKAEESRNNLIERVNNLQTGEDYLSGFEKCEKWRITDHDLMVWESERKKIEIINLFPEFIPGTEDRPLINRGVLNFYCQI